MLGIKAGDIKNSFDNFKQLIHPEDLNRITMEINNRFKDGRALDEECRFRTKSGLFRWFELNGVVKFDNKKKPVRMVGSLIDINDRKLAEENINEKMAELTKLNNIMVSREIKMADMKSEITKLQPPESATITPPEAPSTT
jgi:PAS domain S-box-containing protein